MYSANHLLKTLAKAITPPENSPIDWKIFGEFEHDDVTLGNSFLAVLHSTAIDPLIDENFTFTINAEFAISAQLGDIDFSTFEGQVMSLYRSFLDVLKAYNKQDITNEAGDVVGTLLGYNLAAAEFGTDGNYFTASIPATLYLQA